jgi:hypothetical protein
MDSCELQNVFLIINSVFGLSSDCDSYSGVVFTLVFVTCILVGFFVCKSAILICTAHVTL